MNARLLSVQRGGIELAVQQFDGGGEPLLLIHGIDAEMLYWHDELCSALAADGFHVARFDNRDCGGSSRVDDASVPSVRRVRRNPELAPYRLEDMADDTAAVLDALGWPRAHIVGHSLGGMVGLVLATRHSDRVRSLTAISSTIAGDVGRIRLLTVLRLMRANPADFLGRAPSGPEEAANRLVRGHRVLGSPRYPQDDDWLRALAKVRYARGRDLAARARLAAAGWASGDLRSAVADIRSPVLVVHGDCDPVVRPEGGRAIAAAVPHAKLVMLPGMGHDLPRAIWPALVRHIKANAEMAD